MGANRRNSRRKKKSSSSSSNVAGGLNNNMSKRWIFLKLLVALIVLYSIAIVYFQHIHLNLSTSDVSDSIFFSKNAFFGESGAVEPFDLSVNFLKVISNAPGAPPFPDVVPSASKARVAEDFLPVVMPSEVTFRWRHRARPGSFSKHANSIKAYRVIVRRSEIKGRGETVWDSGKVVVKEDVGVPDSVDYGGKVPLKVGLILEWQVQIWDANDVDSSSSWAKFAVGPETEVDWWGKWIVHPRDMDTFDRRKKSGKLNLKEECKGWKLRRPLPLFRMKLDSQEYVASSEDQISSALLVISGLGSFRASFDGIPLSTSGPIDPPFTDYSKRVSYRGFDVTPFLLGSKGRLGGSHVVGVTTGSGWWDHLPVSGMAKPKLLPRGPVTVMAQIIITYSSGDTRTIGHTNSEKENWQVSRGHIRESDLFTGEMVDLMVLEMMEGWDTIDGWSNTTSIVGNKVEFNKWIAPVPYRNDITADQRKQEMAITAKAMNRSDAIGYPVPQDYAAPIGKLIPNEIPPVMPMERIAPDEVHGLGSGRWLLDFGKAMSGMIHFDDGLPKPIVPEKYPRAHGFKSATANGDSFITVIYGETLEMTTGDINRVLVAGLGLHDGGPRHKSKAEGATKNSKCFPDDHEAILSQRDVYVVPKKKSARQKTLYSKARQSHFTTHSFRFAEVCCTAAPPVGAHALLYRTAVTEWGTFDSSNVLINGGYELVRNAMNSNMLSVQSDCPHREKLPYGGDLVADSPAAMHMFDMSAFYRKTIQDWMDSQWANGAYTETSIWQNLNDYAGIGKGAGETVWASAPPVLTVRHMQHYGDMKLAKISFDHHVKWLQFLIQHFDEGMRVKNYDDELKHYTGRFSGLGDWLAMRIRDTFLTHTAFAMASGRCVAYIARKLGDKKEELKGIRVATKYKKKISYLYLKNGKDNFDFPLGSARHTPGPEMSLFSRIVPGEKRCTVLKNWFKREGHTWPGEEEMSFLDEISDNDTMALVQNGELTKRGDKWAMGWSQWQGLNEGILAIRYALKTLSDNGFHHIALRKVSGFGMATPEYMMRHNATTMWESWWRSEDLYSRNHPMLGAMAEWMPSAAAGVSHHPTTTGGRKMLLWPRFPKSATTLEYASAVQGSIKGDFSIAWRFEDLPSDKSLYNSAIVNIRIRLLIPPSGEGVLRLPVPGSRLTTTSIRKALGRFPDVGWAMSAAINECSDRRKARLGFPYSWEYDRDKKQWYRLESSKSIGTPCSSYLFHPSLDGTKWSSGTDTSRLVSQRIDELLGPGLYDILISDWQLEPEVEGTGRLGNLPEYYKKDNLGPYCSDSSTFEWDIEDATHII